MGDSRAARGARVQRRSNSGSLVRRVPRRILCSDRRRAACGVRRRSPSGSRARCSLQRDGGRHRSCSRCSPCSPPSAGTRSRRYEMSRRGRRACCSTSCRRRSRTSSRRDAADRGPVRLGVDPVRRRRGLHPTCGAPTTDRGGRRPRPSVQPLRCARRAPWAREDQDHRRSLHGRGGRSLALIGTTRHALAQMALDMQGSDALGRRDRASGSSCVSEQLDQSWQA